MINAIKSNNNNYEPMKSKKACTTSFTGTLNGLEAPITSNTKNNKPKNLFRDYVTTYKKAVILLLLGSIPAAISGITTVRKNAAEIFLNKNQTILENAANLEAASELTHPGITIVKPEEILREENFNILYDSAIKYTETRMDAEDQTAQDLYRFIKTNRHKIKGFLNNYLFHSSSKINKIVELENFVAEFTGLKPSDPENKKIAKSLKTNLDKIENDLNKLITTSNNEINTNENISNISYYLNIIFCILSFQAFWRKLKSQH